MRDYETKVQELKANVLREVAGLAFHDELNANRVLDIPQKIIPGPHANMRCCIYKERAVIGDRIKMAMGGDLSNPNVVEVMPIACDECPVTQMTVSESCRGCIATRCVHACPKDAIKVVNHRAVIDHSKCIVCGKCLSACPYGAIVKNRRPCERSCPVSAISMGENKKASIDHSKCISCGTCVYTCPFGAIMDKSFIVDAIGLLKGGKRWGYRVYAMVAPAIAGQFTPASLGQVVTGLKNMGFHDVVEVAYGADLTAWEEAEELAEKGSLLSSCCPAFVAYVRHNFPNQAKDISATPSPMVMAAQVIKEKDPEAKVIFIGPCVAKKMERYQGKAASTVDCVLTFEELEPMFDAYGIDLTLLEETPLQQSSPYGRNFAYSGGVSSAVEQVLKERGIDFQVKAALSSGIEECKVNLLKRGRNLLDANFVEGMACEMGCVNGAGCLLRSPKNKAQVQQYAKSAAKELVEPDKK